MGTEAKLSLIKFNLFAEPYEVFIEYMEPNNCGKYDGQTINFDTFIKLIKSKRINITNLELVSNNVLKTTPSEMLRVRTEIEKLTEDEWDKAYEIPEIRYTKEEMIDGKVVNYLEYVVIKNKKTGNLKKLDNSRLMTLELLDSNLLGLLESYGVILDSMINSFVVLDDNSKEDTTKHIDKVKSFVDKVKIMNLSNIKTEIGEELLAIKYSKYKEEIRLPHMRELIISTNDGAGAIVVSDNTRYLDISFLGKPVNTLNLGSLSLNINTGLRVKNIITTGTVDFTNMGLGTSFKERMKHLESIECSIRSLLLKDIQLNSSIVAALRELEKYHGKQIELKFNF